MGKDYQEHGLYLHNWYRKRHGSPKMVLNDRLNQAADAYAYKLACRRTLQHTSGLDYNENLYMSIGDKSKTKKQHVYAACECWYNEKKFYSYNSPGFSMKTGHFTAMVWKNSTNLGIGYGESNGYIVIVACYKPLANGSYDFRNNVLPYRQVKDSDDEDDKKEEKKEKVVKEEKKAESEESKEVVDGELSWVALSSGAHPELFAVRAGEEGGKDLFVARAKHEGGIVPGKLHLGQTHACIGYGGYEHAKEHYEVLVAPNVNVSWVKSENGAVPSNAVQGGKESSGDKYYIGRATVKNSVSVGKVHPAHKGCYVTHGGYEHWFGDGYEILVQNSSKLISSENAAVAHQVGASAQAGKSEDVANAEAQSGGCDLSPELKSKFYEIADDKKTIGTLELHSLLSWINPEAKVDNILCTLMIRLVTMRTGEKNRINLDEFEQLFERLIAMSECAEKSDKDKSDSLDPFELKEALENSGFKVGFKTVQTLKELFCDGGDYMGENGFLLCHTLFSILQVTRETAKSVDMFEDFSLKDWMKEQMEKAEKSAI